MVAGSSPEWLPPGFTQKVKYKNGRKIKYYCNNATGARHYSKQDVLHSATADNDLHSTPHYSKQDVPHSTTADNDLHSTPQTSKEGDEGLSSDKKDNAVLNKSNDSSQWLPPNGWIIEEKTRKSGSQRGMPYKVYIEPETSNKFYSKAAVTRYLNSVDHSTTWISQNKLDNVDKPVPDTPQCISHTNADSISEKKKKGGSFMTVSTETRIDDDLPSGWIKEIRTSKSGSRIRKDPFYIDPASGYEFRSKKDALRFLKTNDIRNCVCRPLKRELDDPKLNKIPSSNPAIEKLSRDKKELFSRGEVSGTKSPPESEAEILKQTQGSNVSVCVEGTSDGDDSHGENTSNKNSSRTAEIENNPELANEVPKEDSRVMNLSDALSTQQQLPEIGVKKQADKTQPGSRKSKKRGDSTLPLRSSKRLARCEPEVLPSLHLSECSLMAGARKSSGSEVDMSFMLKEPTYIPLPPYVEPEKEALEPPSVTKETLEATKLDKEAAKPPSVSEKTLATEPGKVAEEPLSVSKETLATEPEKESDEPLFVSKETLEAAEPLDKVEKPQSEEPTIPDDPVGGKTIEKQLDGAKGSQEMPLFSFDFGESWSDPLEFAVRTLRGEMSIEDSLKLTGCFSKPVGDPENQVNGSLKSLQSDPPINYFPFMQYNRGSSQSDAVVNFEKEFLSNAGSFQQQSNSAFPSLPSNNLPSFSAPSNSSFLSFSGFNSQSTTEAGKNNFPTNSNRSSRTQG